MKKHLLILVSGVWVCVMGSIAQAETTLTPQAQYAADSKNAMARYTADKKLCNDETSSNARLQCRRDAKAEYDKAMAAAKAQMPATPSAQAREPKAVCAECGKVVAVTTSEQKGEGGPVGLIAGASRAPFWATRSAAVWARIWPRWPGPRAALTRARRSKRR